MTNSQPDRLDAAALRGLDDVQLESLRFWLLRDDDVRYEHVVEHLLVRGIGAIESVVSELCELHGLGSESMKTAVIDASLRLQLRLGREEKLASVEILARRFASQCFDALAPSPTQPPRLASRPPQLRSVETSSAMPCAMAASGAKGETTHERRLRASLLGGGR